MSRADDDGVTTVTLTRPPINALDLDALAELAAMIADLHCDRDVRAIVLASGIEGVFCAGGDLKFWRQFSREQARTVSRAGREVFEAIARLPQPTIAALEGHVIGDGLALALAADLRVASERATFRVPEADYGFIPGWGVTGWLERQAGFAVALEMLLTARPVDARRAHQVGLVSQVVAPASTLTTATTLARALGLKSSEALTWMKRSLREAPRGGDRAAWEEDCFARVWGGEDWAEGVEALLARRPPVFHARERAEARQP